MTARLLLIEKICQLSGEGQTALIGELVSFVHLHTHSEYSLSSSLLSLKDLVSAAQKHKMPAVALTDWANLYGALAFWKACKKAGDLKPIFGVEMGIRCDSDDPQLRHVLLLAKNLEGFQNLQNLVTRAHCDFGLVDGELRPYLPLDCLLENPQGLTLLTGGLKGILNSYLLQDQKKTAQSILESLKSAFASNLYFELQSTQFKIQDQANQTLIEWGQKEGVPLVATADVHYKEADEAFAHEIWMMVSQKLTLEENPRSGLTSAEFYFKSPEEMAQSFSNVPEAISNSLEIAQQCNVELSFHDDEGKRIFFLPEFKGPSMGQDEFFAQESREGLESRFKKHGIDDPEKQKVYTERLDYEIKTIQKMGFAGYYLIVSDFIRWAKRNEIPVGPGRGSGAGSIAAWALDIIDLDPIEFGLVFERFLNPERVSLPDFDVDFCQANRHKVIEYVGQKYGQDHVCQIVTYAKEQSKNAIKDVARVMGLSFAESNRLTKLIPSVQARPLSIQESLDEVDELKQLMLDEPRYKQVFDLAMSLEGALRQPGVHAAGVIIASRPVAELAPLSRDANGNLLTQWDMKMSEEAGLVKFDFLGLVTLDLLDLSCQLIREHGGSQYDGLQYDTIPVDDEASYTLISSGNTLGVFQLESTGMQNLCTRIRPDSFEDIAAINALYRPGPLESGMVDDYINRKHGRAEVSVIFPEMKEILKDTYGVILYQEQVMRLAREISGYTLGGADLLRRAMGKKIAEEMEAQRGVFVSGAEKLGREAKKASELFDLIAKFAGYGFNKSHAAAYAKLAIQTAYLKAKHTCEFFTALLTIERDNTDKMSRYIVDARKNQIRILAPDINESSVHFTKVADREIRFGLSAIKNVGEAAVESIIEARKKEGRFKDFFHFLSSVDLRKLNKRMMEALIQAGAFDQLEENKSAEELRARYLATLESAMEWASKEAQIKEQGQYSLFGDSGGGDSEGNEQAMRPVWQSGDVLTSRQLLDWEKLLMGVYISGSPLDKYEEKIQQLRVTPIYKLKELAPKTTVTVAVLSSEFRELRIKRGRRIGDKMSVLKLEDNTAQVEMVSFPDHHEAFNEALRGSEVLLVHSELDFEDERPKLLGSKLAHEGAPSVQYLKDVEVALPKRITVEMDTSEIDRRGGAALVMEDIAGVLKKYPGPVPVRLLIQKKNHFVTDLNLDKKFSVMPQKNLVRDLEFLNTRCREE